MIRASPPKSAGRSRNRCLCLGIPKHSYNEDGGGSMSETRGTRRGLTRRGFLKTTGAVAGATTLGAALSSTVALANEPEGASAGSETKHFTTWCRGNCGSSCCNLNVGVREGKVVSVMPQAFADSDPETKGRARGCLRGISNLQRMYAPERLQYPLRRVEGTREERGNGRGCRGTMRSAR